ncbi:MAG: SIR2 family protein [Methanobrevibacter sp.]|nr:SIR2 family protein [Methanobrevibacter sp.]
MYISRESFVEEVARHINDNTAALFMGAGVSASTGLPSWREILNPLAEKLGIIITPDADLYQIAQFYNNKYKRNEIVKEYEKRIGVVNEESEYLLAALDLGFREIWTTNYDRAIETCLGKRNIAPKIVNSDHNINALSSGGVHIFKLNGDIGDPANMVITKEDLEKYPLTHELMLTFLKRELVSKSFIFLGYSFSDSLILGNLASIKNCLGDSCTTHYTILEKDNKSNYFIDDLCNRYNIQALLVDSRDEFPLILKEIKSKCTERRVFISGSFDSLPSIEDDFADNLCGSLVEQLYKNNYVIASGMGRKIGNYLAGHAYAYLAQTNPFDMEQKLLLRPFYEKMGDNNKSNHRYNMISECNICLFMFGKSPSIGGKTLISKGVKEEFEIATKLNKAIIPLPTTKYAAKEIYDYVLINKINYPYLEPYLDKLNSLMDPKALSSVVVKICNDYLRWQNRA